jgi:hypothetical protein
VILYSSRNHYGKSLKPSSDVALAATYNVGSFDGLRFLNKSMMSAQQKAAYMPFGGGSRVCIGLHLAWMELRLGAALFFRQCRGAQLGETMRDEMMEMDNRFLISPKGHCCYVILR